MRATVDNVAGVRIPKFEQVLQARDQKMALTGLGAGGKSIQVDPAPRALPPADSHLTCGAEILVT